MTGNIISVLINEYSGIVGSFVLERVIFFIFLAVFEKLCDLNIKTNYQEILHFNYFVLADFPLIIFINFC